MKLPFHFTTPMYTSTSQESQNFKWKLSYNQVLDILTSKGVLSFEVLAFPTPLSSTSPVRSVVRNYVSIQYTLLKGHLHGGTVTLQGGTPSVERKGHATSFPFQLNHRGTPVFCSIKPCKCSRLQDHGNGGGTSKIHLRIQNQVQDNSMDFKPFCPQCGNIFSQGFSPKSVEEPGRELKAMKIKCTDKSWESKTDKQ